jgi:cell division protein FtsL
MRAFEVEYTLHSLTLDVKHIIWLFVLFFVIMFIVFVRINTIKLGYEIYKIEQDIEKKHLILQGLHEEQSVLINIEGLYDTGLKMGLTLPNMENVYYVK